MAKRRRRKYSRGSGLEMKNEMRRYKRGKARGGKVKSARPAIAIGLSKRARRERKVSKKKS